MVDLLSVGQVSRKAPLLLQRAGAAPPAAPASTRASTADGGGPKAMLDSELEADFVTIRALLDRIRYTADVEEQVITKLQRWALESGYLDKLLYKLKTTSKDTGIVRTLVTSYYALILNHFDRANEVREIRDRYSRNFVGDEAVSEVSWFGAEEQDFIGGFWMDVKSGLVADEIVNYFLGIVDAGVGLAEGLWNLLYHPIDSALAIWHLPSTLTILWNNRDQLWNEFKGAPPEEQARVIGRIIGEAEILIAAAAAGGASPTQVASPATAIVPAGGGAAVLVQGGAIRIPLAVLGKGAQVGILLSKGTELGSKGKGKADTLKASGTPVEGGTPAEDTAKLGVSERFPNEWPELQEFLKVADKGEIPKENPNPKLLSRAVLDEYKQRTLRIIEQYQKSLEAATDETRKQEWQRKIDFQRGRLQKVDQALSQWKFESPTTPPVATVPSTGPIAAQPGPVLKGKIEDVKPATITQQIALDNARAGDGEVIIRELNDRPRLVALYGEGEWVKMQYVLKDAKGNAIVTVHYFKNLTTSEAVEFKFTKAIK